MSLPVMFPGNPKWQWAIAIHFWRLGHPETLIETIKGDVPRTPEAVAFLAELAAGEAKKYRGRPKSQQDDASRLWSIIVRFAELRPEIGKDDALAQVAKEFHTSESTVSQWVYPRAEK